MNGSSGSEVGHEEQECSAMKKASSLKWIVRRIGSPMLIAAGAGLVVLAIGSLMKPWNGWPPSATCGTEACKEAREWMSSGVTLIVLLAGLYQYRKAQLWKRAEFVAAEMKAFFSDAEVRRATTMIDWGIRKINLFSSLNTDQTSWPTVTREMQCRALSPHVLISDVATDTMHPPTEVISGAKQGFSLVEAAIRDSYDGLLDGLERFSSYLEAGLLSKDDLEPYLGYWIRDIASDGEDATEKLWTAMLFVYIDFYDFSGVQKLFRLYGSDIGYESDRLNGALKAIGNLGAAETLSKILKEHHEGKVS
jgi:hypothetical protein